MWAEKYGQSTRGPIPGTELKACRLFGELGQNWQKNDTESCSY